MIGGSPSSRENLVSTKVAPCFVRTNLAIANGGGDKEGMLKWPVIENKRAERGCRMRSENPR